MLTATQLEALLRMRRDVQALGARLEGLHPIEQKSVTFTAAEVRGIIVLREIVQRLGQGSAVSQESLRAAQFEITRAMAAEIERLRAEVQ